MRSDCRYCFNISPLHLSSPPDPLPTLPLPPLTKDFISNVREKNSQFSLLTLKSTVTRGSKQMVELTFDLQWLWIWVRVWAATWTGLHDPETRLGAVWLDTQPKPQCHPQVLWIGGEAKSNWEGEQGSAQVSWSREQLETRLRRSSLVSTHSCLHYFYQHVFKDHPSRENHSFKAITWQWSGGAEGILLAYLYEPKMSAFLIKPLALGLATSLGLSPLLLNGFSLPPHCWPSTQEDVASACFSWKHMLPRHTEVTAFIFVPSFLLLLI